MISLTRMVALVSAVLMLFSAVAWAGHESRHRTYDRGGNLLPPDHTLPSQGYSPSSSPYGRPLDLSPPPVYRPWPPDYRPAPDPWPYGPDKPRRGRSLWDE